MNVSLIIPAYNEAGRLSATLLYYGEAFRARYGADFEIVVVANGCRDNTAALADGMRATFPEIRVIDIPQAIGKGGAVLEGFRQALGQRIVFADADAATTAESLFALLERLNRNDAVIGSRRLPGSVITRRQPLRRRLFSRAFSASVALLFDLPYRDTQCGAKAFRRDAAQRLADAVVERSWAFDVDLLLCARALGLHVAEHPVAWSDRDGSQLRVGSTLRQVLGSLWRMRIRHAQPFLASAAHVRRGVQ